MFNWFSLDIIYYPVSAIMWAWYKLFGLLLGPSNFFAWGLSVMFLVFTLRAILYKPFVRQIRTTRQMQELQPQIKALQKKYGKDRQRMALEMQKLQREHGFNPLMGCLPIFAQVPVFLGLYHVLRSFNRTVTGGMGGSFGPHRLMWGSDVGQSMRWTYPEKAAMARAAADFLTDEEAKAFLHDNAARVYRLNRS